MEEYGSVNALGSPGNVLSSLLCFRNFPWVYKGFCQPSSPNRNSSIHKGLPYPPGGSKASFHLCEQPISQGGQLRSISLYKHSAYVWAYPLDMISDWACLQLIHSLLKTTNRLLTPSRKVDSILHLYFQTKPSWGREMVWIKEGSMV